MATIICIDDNPEQGKHITDLLKMAGYNALLANSEEAGLEMITNHIPSLILYGITTPHENRYQVMGKIREKYPLLAETVFVFLSDASDKKQILTDLKAGADSFLTTPIDPTLLLATVQANLRQVKRIKFKHEKLLVLDI